MAATSVIQLDAVSKTFGRGKRRVQALKGVHLDVAPGQVYGFLGPNGAGKTTTIRILLNLVRVTAGEIRVLGIDPRRDPSVLRKVGAQVESPSFYGYLSGRANLQVLAHTSGLKTNRASTNCWNRWGWPPAPNSGCRAIRWGCANGSGWQPPC